MFTGLITEVGAVRRAVARAGELRLTIVAPATTASASVGDSIAVNGVCLTVVHRAGDMFQADVMAETVEKTNLRWLRSGSRVNLERALRADQHLEGHLVQGHVDGVGRVLRIDRRASSAELWILAPPAVRPFLAQKGSIAVDGVSLTIADRRPDSLAVDLIPHTQQVTNLGDRRPGDLVNLEADMIAKYLTRYREAGRQRPLTAERLKELGF